MLPVGMILRSVSPMVVVVPDRSPVLALPWIRMVPVVRTGWLHPMIFPMLPLFRYGTREATPSITSAADVAGAVGKPFTYRIQASSNPTSFGANGLPSWMSLDTATGEITGTPTATGTTNFKVFAYNQYAASIKDVTINVIDLDDWEVFNESYHEV